MITTAKPGDIVWCVCGSKPTPLFVHSWGRGKLVRLTHRRDSDDVVARRSSEQLCHTFDELLLYIWKPRAFDESCDQKLKDAVSRAYNAGVGSFSVGHSKPSDPVHRDGDKWYFWDETGADRCGPYDTEEEARDKMQDYAETVLGHQPTNIQTHGSFEHSDGTMHCTPEACAPTANARLSIEHIKKSFDKQRKSIKAFQEAVLRATGAVKKLGDTLDSVNPCGEVPLESTPPDSDTNEGVTITCPDCNVVDTVFLPERKIGAWARGECVCNYIKSRSHYTREHNFIGSRESFSKTVLGARFDTIDRDDIHFHDATPEQTAKSNEAFDKEQAEMKAMREAAEGDSCTFAGFERHVPDGPIPEITLEELSGEEFPPRENFLTKEEAKKMWDEAGGCDCGGPADHLPGGSHCRKPL